MPTYIEDNNKIVLLGTNNTIIKPILFTNYTSETTYYLNITYEDETTKTVELVQNDKERLYKIIYKKEGKLLTITGVIKKIYEINENSKFCDFTNKTMDSEDLLFTVDYSDQYELHTANFYLKDIRDIIDIANEETDDDDPVEEPNDPVEDPIEEPEDEDIPLSYYTLYPMYLNNKPYNEVIECEVDEELKGTLTAHITKNTNILPNTEYSGFTVLSVESPAMFDYTADLEPNKVPIMFTEECLNKEIKIVLSYFVNEIRHPIFEEFRVKAVM